MAEGTLIKPILVGKIVGLGIGWENREKTGWGVKRAPPPSAPVCQGRNLFACSSPESKASITKDKAKGGGGDDQDPSLREVSSQGQTTKKGMLKPGQIKIQRNL